jgi:solute carrier family 12 sodium/potassium/chloride transporter 2
MTEMRAGLVGGWFVTTVLAGTSGLLVLRGGRVVGEAGAAGALLLWLAVALLTLATASSLTAVLTNARIGAPSTIEAIRTSLGRGVASLVAVPMWLARAFAAASAAFVIAESTPAFLGSEVLIALLVVACAAASTRISAPYVPAAAPFVLLVAVGGVASMLAGPASARTGGWLLAADYGGLLAYVVPVAAAVWVAPDGVAITGETRRPAQLSWSLAVAWLVQLALIAWFSQVATAKELVADPQIGLNSAAVPLAARLGMVIGAAYLLVASLTDGARIALTSAAHVAPSLERPWVPELATAGVAATAVVSIRHLDGTATAWTLALLFAFAALNTVVGIELFLGLSSFRPAARPNPIVPVVAAIAAACAMLLTHAAGALTLTAVVFGGAFVLVTPGRNPGEHSALVTALAEWLARRTSTRAALRAWKPALIVPTREVERTRSLLELLTEVARPEGSVRFLGLGAVPDKGIVHLSDAMRSQNLDTDHTWIETDAPEALGIALETLRLAVFRPNLVVLQLSDDPSDDPVLASRIATARRAGVGVLLVGTPPGAPVVGYRRTITLWVRSIPGSWDPLEGYEGRNLDLTLLLGYRLAARWGSQLRLVTVVTEPEHRLGAEQFLASLCGLARLPPDTIRLGIVGTFEQAVDDLSNSDLDVFGLQPQPDLERVRRLVARARSTCLFVLDSGRESALV